MSRAVTILEKIARGGRVAGAYLFTGASLEEKKAAAEKFSDLLACAKQDKMIISPAGQSLKIDQIRELQTWVRFGPSAGKFLTVIVERADALTDEAAAAFLKTLEEPAPGVVFILLSEREDKLPATILSRCQKIIFGDTMVEWQPGDNPFYEDLAAIKDKKSIERLALATRLEADKEKMEERLYDLSYYARYKLEDVQSARVILDTLRGLKRRANARLALDVMCLKMGGNYAGYAAAG
jgi:DNA polymerase III delta prime subunit